MDKEGFVYCRVNQKRLSQEELKRTIYGQPEKVYSQLNNSYATVLNLYDKHREGISELYPLSLHYFQSDNAMQKRAINLIKSKLDILSELGYIVNHSLSQKGRFASAIYGYELILSELYEDGFLEHLDKFKLGILASAIVFEPRKIQQMTPLSGDAKFIKGVCDELISKLQKRELKYRIYPLSKKPYFHLSGAIAAWLKGANFQKILTLTDTDEGEIVRYFRMAVQLLRQLSETPAAEARLRAMAKKALVRINRDVIDAEAQLRLG
jgi:superfamily II RNA helicase